jgi:hypothetical protein
LQGMRNEHLIGPANRRRTRNSRAHCCPSRRPPRRLSSGSPRWVGNVRVAVARSAYRASGSPRPFGGTCCCARWTERVAACTVC